MSEEVWCTCPNCGSRTCRHCGRMEADVRHYGHKLGCPAREPSHPRRKPLATGKLVHA